MVMVEDPLIDFEEVVVGIWSLGSNPMARGDISRRFFQITIPYFIVSYVPDGD
jgi:hypothetical protein